MHPVYSHSDIIMILTFRQPCWLLIWLPVSLAVSGMAWSAQPANDTADQFDTSILKSRGIPADVVNYFSQAPRFMPGVKPVRLSVNGDARGTVSARFGSEGQLCPDAALLRQAGLKVPKETQADANGCYDYALDFPGTSVTLSPGENRVSLVVPPEALERQSSIPGGYLEGGTAGLLNYNAFATRSRTGGRSTDYTQGTFISGLNMGDWLIRSSQLLSNNNGSMALDTQYTYAQHTFADTGMMLQTGQINLANTLFASAPVLGAQWIPDSALSTQSGNNDDGITVSGIARTAQARVEIRQAGALIYSTLVPAGPFTLTKIPVLNVRTDLDVTVVETDGSRNQFTVSSGTFAGSGLGSPLGFALAAGQVRDTDSRYGDPWLLTATDGWKVKSYLNTRAGGMMVQNYGSVAGGLDIVPWPALTLSADTLSAADRNHHVQGNQFTLSANYRAPHNLSFSFSGTQNTPGFRDLNDALQDDGHTGYDKNSWNMTMGWSQDFLGAFSLGYARTQGFDTANDTRRLITSWRRNFGGASVSVNWQGQVGGNGGGDGTTVRNDNDIFYASVSIPWGEQSVNTYVRNDGTGSSTGVQTSGRLTPTLDYSVSADRDIDHHASSINGSLNSNLHYTRLGLNAGSHGYSQQNYGASLSGGIVAHQHGVTFSPSPVQETFGVIDLGRNVSGVAVSTPQGTVWTDAWGQAVVPSLPAYRTGRVELDAATLPKNADVDNGTRMVTAGHGAVPTLNFALSSVRRGMLHVSLPDNGLLPRGAVIVDAQGKYVTQAVAEGVVFLADLSQTGVLYAELPDSRRCRLIFQAGPEENLTDYYETLTAECQSVMQ